jgi:hypothetical protein
MNSLGSGARRRKADGQEPGDRPDKQQQQLLLRTARKTFSYLPPSFSGTLKLVLIERASVENPSPVVLYLLACRRAFCANRFNITFSFLLRLRGTRLMKFESGCLGF